MSKPTDEEIASLHTWIEETEARNAAVEQQQRMAEVAESARLAERLYVALVEERNLTAQRYGEFQTAPVTADDVAIQLAKVRDRVTPQMPLLADVWDEAYRQGVADEQMSAENIGLEGLGVKTPAARVNPFRTGGQR